MPTIKIKSSNIADNKPQDLLSGELAINTADEKLYFKNADGEIVGISKIEFGDTVGTAVEGNDSRLSDAREWVANEVTSQEALEGSSTVVRKWTAQKVRQAIMGWWTTVVDSLVKKTDIGSEPNQIPTNSQLGKLAFLNSVGADDLQEQYIRSIDLPVATDTEIQEGIVDAPRQVSPRQLKLLSSGTASIVTEEVFASKVVTPDVRYTVMAPGVTLTLPATLTKGSSFTAVDASGEGFQINWNGHTVKNQIFGGARPSPMTVPAYKSVSVVYSGSTLA